MGEEDDAKGPKADVFSAGVVMIETNTGQHPKPGPAKRKEGRRRVDIPEEERRAGRSRISSAPGSARTCMPVHRRL